MIVVTLTDEERKIYDVFFKLRKKLPNIMIKLLRQISIYIGKSNKDLDFIDIYNINEDSYEILLNDGRKIRFSSNKFEFTILKEENNFLMKTTVCEDIDGNLLIDGIVKKDNDLVYLINSYNSEGLIVGKIGCYNESGLMIDSSSFDIVPEIDSPFDIYDGCIGNFLVRIDLLYDNMKCVFNYKKLRKKKVS